MAKFDPQQILKSIQRNSEYGVIGVLLIVSVVMFYLLERRPELTIPPVTTINTSSIPFPKEAEADINRALNELKPLDQTSFQKDLLQRNLFSFKEVLNKQALEKELSDKMKRAQTFFDQQNYQQAIDLCDEILQSDPNREPAKQLKEKAQKALQTISVSTTTTQ